MPLSSIVQAAVTALQGASPDDATAPRSLADLALVQLDGSPLPPDALTGKVVLVVNVASRCGFTSQYEGLQALWQARRDEGLVIVGVPCNQFGWQEPGDADSIRTWCSMTYGVDFPMLEKQRVNGPQRSDLYRLLVASEVGGGGAVRWNFEKFLLGRDGGVRARFLSNVEPTDPALATALDAALAEPAPDQ